MPILEQMPPVSKKVPASQLKYPGNQKPPSLPMAVEGSQPKLDQLVPSTWHPGKYIVHEIKAEDNWWSVAQQHNMDVKDLIKFNFNTLDPAIINWYMHNVLGCDHRTEDGKNWVFSGTMRSNPANAGKSRPGLLYIPQDSVVFEDDPIYDPPAKTWTPVSLSLQNVLAVEFSYGPAAVKYLWGELHFRLLMQPGPAYRWQFQIPLGGLSVPSWITKGIPVGSIKMVGGKLKLPASEVKFWGGFSTTEWGCDWDLGLYDPRIMWPEKRIALSLSAWDVKMWVWDGFGGRQTASRRVARKSVRGIPVYQDSSHLEFSTKTDEVLPEMGWFRGNNNGLLHSGGYGMSA